MTFCSVIATNVVSYILHIQIISKSNIHFHYGNKKKTINFAHIIQTHTNTYTHTTSTDMNSDRVVDLYELLQTWRINLKNLIICTYSDKFVIRIAINVHWDPHLFHPKTDNILKPTHTNKLHTYIHMWFNENRSVLLYLIEQQQKFSIEIVNRKREKLILCISHRKSNVKKPSH